MNMEKMENVPQLEITVVVLVHCNNAINVSQHDSRALSTFVPNKPLSQLLDILPTIKKKSTLNSDFSYIEVWFTDENSKLLEIEDKTKHYFHF